MWNPMLRIRLIIVAAVISPWLLAGCDTLFGTGPDIPDEARIEVDAEPTAPLVVIVSSEFDVVFDEIEGRFVSSMTSADTVEVLPEELPFSARYDMQPENRLLARVLNPEPDTTLVRLTVWLDGSLAHDVTRGIADGQHIEYTTIY